jgi:hypothetical protein
MAYIDKTGHLKLDNPLGLVLCPVTGEVEDLVVLMADTAPSEPLCDGCYEVFNFDLGEEQRDN